MSYFTDSPFEKMMMQKPQYSATTSQKRPQEKEQKIRKLIIVHEKTDTPKPRKEG